MKTYTLVVETGSYRVDEDGTWWEVQSRCGHNHRTISAAEKCNGISTCDPTRVHDERDHRAAETDSPGGAK